TRRVVPNSPCHPELVSGSPEGWCCPYQIPKRVRDDTRDRTCPGGGTTRAAVTPPSATSARGVRATARRNASPAARSCALTDRPPERGQVSLLSTRSCFSPFKMCWPAGQERQRPSEQRVR